MHPEQSYVVSEWTPGAGDRAIRDWHTARGTTDPAVALDAMPAPRLTLRERFAAFRLERLFRTMEVMHG